MVFFLSSQIKTNVPLEPTCVMGTLRVATALELTAAHATLDIQALAAQEAHALVRFVFSLVRMKSFL